MITDRLRFTVLEANTDRILSRDLVVKNPQVVKNLSGPSNIEFRVPAGEWQASSQGINWNTWGQTIVAELEVNYVRQIFACAIVTDSKVDPQNGDMEIKADGYLGYPKGIPFLENFNPIAVDPFEIVQRIWAHLESFSNANLGVQVVPASSGTQILPGYSFDGSTLSFDFFAVFYRAVDFQDCADIMNGLARDIPFDIVETPYWDSTRTILTRQITLGYPKGGAQQNYLTFRLGENVIQAQQMDEREIQPVTDVIIRGWLPGKVYSSQLSNEDPTRFRRVVMEENAFIDSTERAAAWAKRKLTRRNIPVSFSKILIDPNHPSGPYGSFDVGDSIWVSAVNYPWVGDIAGWHRITSITYAESTSQGGGGGGGGQGNSSGTPEGMMALELRIEGAFNYDPIEYDPHYDDNPTVDPNRIHNGYFSDNLQSWTMVRGQWIRTASIVYETHFATNSGSVRIDCDDHGEAFLNSPCTVNPGEHLTVECVVQWENVVSTPGVAGFILRGFTTMDADPTPGETIDFDSVVGPTSVSGWHVLKVDDWLVPDGINELALQLTVDPSVTAGTAFWTYVRVYPTGYFVTPVV